MIVEPATVEVQAVVEATSTIEIVAIEAVEQISPTPTSTIAVETSPTPTATPTLEPTPTPTAAPNVDASEEGWEVIYSAPDLGDMKWVDDALPINGTRHWRPAPLGRGVGYVEGAFVRITKVERMPAPCPDEYGLDVPGEECLKATLQLFTDPDPHPRDVDPYTVEFFLIDGEAQEDWSTSSAGSSDGTEMATFILGVETGWQDAILVYSPLFFEPIAFLSLVESDFEAASQPLSGEARERYESAAKGDRPGLIERLTEIGFDWSELSPPDQFSLEVQAHPITLALTCAEYVGLPASTPESTVLAMAESISKTAAGEALPEYFADLDDAATFCGTAFPESSKPLILLMMATSTHGVCLFGDAGAFGADVSDVMLAAEKFFNYWGAESPVSLSDFDDGYAVCEWLLDQENEALIELAAAVNPQLFGAAEQPDASVSDAPSPTPTPEIVATIEPAQPEMSSAERKDAQGIVFDPGEVARDDTLILSHGGSDGRFIDHKLWNPYSIGANHQQGSNLIFEPLAFYSAFADEEIMWLAESYSYNEDFTELIIIAVKASNGAMAKTLTAKMLFTH